MKSAKAVVVVGSLNVDHTMRVGRLPVTGETLVSQSYEVCWGGKGANQAIACARAGAQVDFIGTIGDDALGRQLSGDLAKEGVGIHSLQVVKDRSTGTAFIVITGDGNNAIVIAPGANGSLTPAIVQSNEELISKAGALVLQLESPLESVICAARIAHNAGVPIILNPAPASQLPVELYELTRLIVPNETEAATITGISVATLEGAASAASVFHDRGVANVIITLGAAGAWVSIGVQKDGAKAFAVGESFLVSPFSVIAVDSVAAGDTFVGFLSAELLQNGFFQTNKASQRVLLESAVLRANAASAMSVSVEGVWSSIPNRDAVEAFLVKRKP